MVEQERALPSLQHVGEMAKTYLMPRAVRDGFNDAVLVDRRGRLSEGTIWNLAFWDGDAVVMNSWTPGVAVNRIGAVPLPEAPRFVELLHPGL